MMMSYRVTPAFQTAVRLRPLDDWIIFDKA